MRNSGKDPGVFLGEWVDGTRSSALLCRVPEGNGTRAITETEGRLMEAQSKKTGQPELEGRWVGGGLPGTGCGPCCRGL